jgi:RNA polymerase sigma-70 factor (ECF subfamily)
MEELEMICGALSGDHAAFSALVETYQTPVFNLCYRMLGDRCEAEDAAQEAFLRAYSRLRSYDPARPCETWLLSSAAHYCIDRLRTRRVTVLGIDAWPVSGKPSCYRARFARVRPKRQAEGAIQYRFLY